jgi:hypothetical protein
LLWELGGLVHREEGLDIRVLVESVTLPTLGRAERLGWERAKGHVFITLEDEERRGDLIVRADIYQRYRGVLRGALLLLVKERLHGGGHPQRVGGEGGGARIPRCLSTHSKRAVR